MCILSEEALHEDGGTDAAGDTIREEPYKGFLRGNGGGRSVHSWVRIDKFAGDEGLALVKRQFKKDMKGA
jgi:hypothetical protein